MKKIKGSFVSVWADGSIIHTSCELNPKTGELFPKIVDTGEHGSLEREYFETPNEEMEVCITCHEFILKTVIGNRSDLSYGEYRECSNPDCESHE